MMMPPARLTPTMMAPTMMVSPTMVMMPAMVATPAMRRGRRRGKWQRADQREGDNE
jgi:hypothetical protein